MTKKITFSASEKIAVFEYNKFIHKSIQTGLLDNNIYDSRIYLASQRALLVFILVLDPLTYKEIKELALMTINSVVSIVSENTDLAREADSIWDKYKNRFAKYMAFREDIIKSGFINYDLKKTQLNIGNGITVPISYKAFLEKYNTSNPVGFPGNFDDFISAMNKIGQSLSQTNKPNSGEKEYKSLTRARAFYIFQMYLDGMITDDDILSKKKIIEISLKEFPKDSGRTVYLALLCKEPTIYNHKNSKKEIIKVRELHKSDYKYGLNLYKMKYPDS
jgi:hypothetical protein